jgi:uncharacterized protein (DUF1499 family)
MPLIFALLLYPINDVTTTLEAPPLIAAQKYPEEMKERHVKFYSDLQPLHSQKSSIEVFEAAERLAKMQPNWEVRRTHKMRIEAVAVSPLIGFKDDIAIEVRQESSGCSVHMRSKSRIGKSDLGANAKRIRVFLEELKKEI